MKNILPITFVIFIVVAGCKKENKSETQRPPVSTLFKDIESTPQSINVDAGRDTIVYGSKGTLLHFYNNSFKDAAGNVIKSGSVNIQLREMYKPGDMIANRAPTTTDQGLLQSGGEVNIIATLNGMPVAANKYGIGFKQPGASSLAMGLYYGDRSNKDSVVTWTASDGSKGTQSAGTIYRKDTTSGFGFGMGYYNLMDSCTHFNFVNCDRLFDGNGESTAFKVTIPDRNFIPANTQLFLALPDKNVMTQSDIRQLFDDATNTFTLGNHDNQVPVGEKYIVVAIANIDGKYYYNQASGVITSGINITMTPTPETRGDIVARLSGL